MIGKQLRTEQVNRGVFDDVDGNNLPMGANEYISQVSNEYDDIINLPRPEPGRPRMAMDKRAAQFSAFKALSGYDAEVEEAARLTDIQAELDEDAKEYLNARLQIIQENVVDQPLVRIVYFVPDDKKAGGEYVSVTERIKKIDEQEHVLVFHDGSRIDIDRIYSIEGDILDRF